MDEALGQNLFRLMRDGPDDELKLTENAQPAIMAQSLAVFRVLTKDGGIDLNESENYKDAVSSSGLPDQPQMVLYVDIHSTIPAVERLESAPIPAEVKRNLTPLRSAVEYAVSRSHELEVSFFLSIK